MAQGVKKRRAVEDAPAAAKKCKVIPTRETPVKRDLLKQCYARVQTLREYLLAKLPGSSRLRRRKIEALGQGTERRELEDNVAHHLDTTLVCIPKEPPVQKDSGAGDIRWQQWLSFSQKGDESYVTLSGGSSASFFSQSEVCTFANCTICPVTDT